MKRPGREARAVSRGEESRLCMEVIPEEGSLCVSGCSMDGEDEPRLNGCLMPAKRRASVPVCRHRSQQIRVILTHPVHAGADGMPGEVVGRDGTQEIGDDRRIGDCGVEPAAEVVR